MRWEDVLEAQQEQWAFWRSDVGRAYAQTFAADQDMKHGHDLPGSPGSVPAVEMAAQDIVTGLIAEDDPHAAALIAQPGPAGEAVRAKARSKYIDLHTTDRESRQRWGDRRIREIQEAIMFHADPIAIEPDMWTLIEHAQREFQPEPLRETDLITPAGFILLPRPLLTKDIWGKTTSYRAIGWMPLLQTRAVPESPALEMASELMGWGQEQTGIWLALYAHIDDPDDWMDSDKAAKAAMIGFPKLTLAHQAPWGFGRDYAHAKPEQMAGMHPGSFYEQAGVDWSAAIDSYVESMRSIQALFRLLQQTIAVHRTERPPRATRRRAARLDYPEKDVTVVYLRRPRDDSHPADREGKTVEWSHRWIVSGHWRNQWYASLGEHRQIWINPFVKGPEDQPLRIRERRAFSLQR